MGHDKAAFAALAKNKQKVISDRDRETGKERQIEKETKREMAGEGEKESKRVLC